MEADERKENIPGAENVSNAEPVDDKRHKAENCTGILTEEMKWKNLDDEDREGRNADQTGAGDRSLMNNSTADNQDHTTADMPDGKFTEMMTADQTTELETDCGMTRGRRPRPPVDLGDEDDEMIIGVTPMRAARLNPEERLELFKRGAKYEKQGKKELALKCYLRCMMGVSEREEFPFIVECIRDTARIYRGKGEHKKANQFIRAAEIYETPNAAESSDDETHFDTVGHKTAETEEVDAPACLKTAKENEILAQIYLKKGDCKLALQYAAKCVKLQQKVYGMQHPSTQQGLDFFSLVYAQVGKQKLVEALKQKELLDGELEEDQSLLLNSLEEDLEQEVSVTTDKTAPKIKKEVSFGATSIIDDEDPEWLSTLFLRFIFVMAFLIFSTFGFLLYCESHPKNALCLATNQHSKLLLDKLEQFFQAILSLKKS